MSCLVLSPGAQLPLQPAATGTGIISGRVVDVQTGAPISGARVNLRGTGAPVGTRNRYDTAATDAAGSFIFRNLPAGEFDVAAGAQEYLEGAAGRRRSEGRNVWIKLGEGQAFTNLTIELERAGRIRGQVLDESGRPAAGIAVEAWRQDRSTRIETSYRGTPSAVTNADGLYVLWGVPPGDYFVVLPVSHHTWRVPLTPVDSCVPPPPPPPPGTASGPKPPALVEPQPIPGSIDVRLPRGYSRPIRTTSTAARTYATTFYPGETDPALASTIAIESGKTQTNVDFRLETVLATTVRGRLIRPSGKTIGAGTAVMLRRAGGHVTYPDRGYDATGFVDDNQQFTFLDVPAGAYTLEVSLAIFAGHCDVGPGHLSSDVPTEIPLDVTTDGIDDLVVPVIEGLEATGEVVIRGTAPRPPSIGFGAISENGRRVSDSTGNGLFQLVGLTTGRWTLRASANAEWSVESIRQDGRDLTVEPLVVGTANSFGIVVTVTDQVASVRGQVFEPGGRLVDDATAVAFPSDRRLWVNANAQMMRFPTARALGGSYEFASVIPGEYTVAAVDERRMDDWPSVAFLESIQAGAARVQIRKGESLTMALTLRTPSK